MSVPPEQFARIAGRINLSLLATKLVVIAGVGTVGSQMARELASSGVGRLLLIDHDSLQEANLVRHALPREYLRGNKAAAAALYLATQVPTLQAAGLPHNTDDFIDAELDQLFNDADLIVAATDDRSAQRRIAQRSLALDVPVVLPALYGDNGGEVFVQRSPRNPCFFCWDGYRPVDEQLRGVAALNVDTLAVLQLAVQLSLGILDPRSDFASMMHASHDDPRPPQLFIQRRFAALEMVPQARRPNCPSCAVGPSPLRERNVEGETTPLPPTAEPPPPLSPSARRQRNVNRVLLAVCAAIAATLLIVMLSTNSRPPAEISAPVSVKLDYSQSLFTLIAAAHLQTIEHEVPITETQFPVGMSGPERVKVVLVRLTRFKSSEATDVVDPAHDQAAYNEVLDDLSQLGYRPATLPELLALIAQDPEMQSPSIVELAGPAYRRQDVACEASQGYLQCSTINHGFDPAAEFVAVPEAGA